METIEDNEITAAPSPEPDADQLGWSRTSSPAPSSSGSSSEALGAAAPLTPAQLSKNLPRLLDNQEAEMTSELIGPIKITFSKAAEQAREKRKHDIIPRKFTRTAYETSITLSAYTSKDTHAKHREEPELKIEKGNAFQPVCAFEVAKDLNRERIERHLIWNKKKNPSSYISVFDHLDHAKRRAFFHYKDSQRIGQRVFLTQIDTTGLVAATVSARCRTTVDIKTKVRFHNDEHSFTHYEFDVDIPVWIRDPRSPEDRSDLTVNELRDLNTDMWISITEIRQSNLRDGPKSREKYNRDCICAKGHDYEWLACGSIPKSRIIRVMPFDGKVLYEKRTTQIIRSRDSTEPWVWSWDKEMWVLDSALTAIAERRDMEAEQAREARKRRLEGDESEDVEQRPVKRIKPIELTIIRPYIKSLALRTGTALAC